MPTATAAGPTEQLADALPTPALTDPQQVNRLSISPDKRFLAAAGNGTVKLYDIAATAAGSGGANVGPVRGVMSCSAMGAES